MQNRKICGIYMIRNKVNDKKYIGLSRDCFGRMSRHRTNLKHNKHSNCHLQAAWNTYGESAFEFSIVEESSLDILPDREIYWISYYDSFKNGYNRSGGGDGTTSAVLSQERNELISIALTGRKRNDEYRSDNPNARRVVCLNDGEHFLCIKDAADKYSIHYEGIIKSCSDSCTVGDNMLVFSYEEEYEKLTHDEKINKIITAARARLYKKQPVKIVCLNSGEVFNSADDAASYAGLKSTSDIHRCCKGRGMSSGMSAHYEPLVWAYETDYRCMTPAEIKQKVDNAKSQSAKRFRIICLETGEIFDNATIAARHFSISNVTLSAHLRTTGEYHKLMDDGNHLTFKIA